MGRPETVVNGTLRSGAFFTGRLIGGEKLAPDISPGKTRSGAIGGFVFATVAGTVLWMVLREALALVVVGGLIGLPLAFLAARSMRALLFNVGAGDPLAFLLGGVLLMAVAAVAAYLPAYRASRIEPMVALGR